MNHRNSALIAMFVLFGAVAVEVRLERPRTSVELYYDRARLATLLPWRSFAFDLRYDSRPFTSFLADWAALDLRFAINMPPPAAGQPEDNRALSVLANKETLSADMPPAPIPSAKPGVVRQPELDIARISPDGTSVFAGRAAPGTAVTVLENDKPVGTARAGADGGWSLTTEHRFASADPDIGLKTEASTPEELASARSAAEEPAGVAAAPAAKPGTATATPADREQAAPIKSERSPAGQLIDDLRTAVETARRQADEKEPENLKRSAPEVVLDLPQQPPPSAQQQAMAPPLVPAAPTAVEPAAIRDTPPETTIIPVPIPFEYKQAVLTDEGQQAATLLLEYLKLKAPNEATLSGHADETGEADYNMNLSQERLDAVVRVLRDGGYTGKVTLLPKGESQPFSGVDRSRLNSEELMQLDRRVELRIAH